MQRTPRLTLWRSLRSGVYVLRGCWSPRAPALLAKSPGEARAETGVRECGGDLRSVVFRLLDLVRIGLRCRAGDRVRTVDPAAEIDEPTTFGAEGKRRQLVQACDLIALPTNRATPANHVAVPLEVDGEEEVVLAAGLLSPLDALAVSEDFVSLGLSAAAPFLYDSLR